MAEFHGRIGIFDVVRGFSVVSMVMFHLCYDLTSIVGLNLEWFSYPIEDVWRATISWTFLFVAGCVCPLSRNNLRRAGVYGAVAVAIWLVTTLAKVDTPISFGIIYCMSACTFVMWALRRLGLRLEGPYAAVVFAGLFLAALGLQNGSVCFGLIEVPRVLYSTPWFSWLGIPGPGFASGDYYPLLPYLFLFASGCALGSWTQRRGWPDWATRPRCEALSLIGRHALFVYVIHQPVILGLCSLVV